MSFYLNMLNYVDDRHPVCTSSGNSYEVVNSIDYNCKANTKVVWGSDADFIGNIFKNNSTVQPNTSFAPATFRYHANVNGTPYESWVSASEGTVWEEDNWIIGDNAGTTTFI